MSTETIFLTGATGLVGQRLLPRLMKRGYKVRCLVRSHSRAKWVCEQGADAVVGDVTKPETLRNALHEIDIIIHLAILVSVHECLKNPVGALRTNTLGTLNLLEEVRREREQSKTPPLLIYLSSDRVYGNKDGGRVSENTFLSPLDPYAVTKAEGELWVRAFHSSYDALSYIIIRSGNIYGSGQARTFLLPSVISQIMEGKTEISVGNMRAYRNYLHVDDAVEALLLVLRKRKKALNAIFNAAECCMQVSGVLNILKHLTETYLNRTVRFAPTPERSRRSSLEFKKFALDCSAIRHLGWKPHKPFKKGVEETFLAFLRDTDYHGQRTNT